MPKTRANRAFTYFDVARITKNMTSKEIHSPRGYLYDAREFVSLERALCHLISQWMIEYPKFEDFIGAGLGLCLTDLVRWLNILEATGGQDFEGFGGGEFGGAGAGGTWEPSPGGIHWPWEGNPLKPKGN